MRTYGAPCEICVRDNGVTHQALNVGDDATEGQHVQQSTKKHVRCNRGADLDMHFVLDNWPLTRPTGLTCYNGTTLSLCPHIEIVVFITLNNSSQSSELISIAASSRAKYQHCRWHTYRITLTLILQNREFLLCSTMLIMLMSRSNVLEHSFTEAGKCWHTMMFSSRKPGIDVEHPDGRNASL